jgi:hypothetical protein
MKSFFEGARPGQVVAHGTARFELPVMFFRDTSFSALFSADLRKVRALLPTDNLYPVVGVDGRALVAVMAFDYLSTSIGPYGEVAVAALVVYGRRPPPLVPALAESLWPGAGYLVLEQPVTRRHARDGGRGHWGHPKFVADMDFGDTPEEATCRVEEGAQHILTLRVAKRGLVLPDRRPLVTYSVLDGTLLRTNVSQSMLARTALGAGGSSLEIGDAHPVARSLCALDISYRPILTRHFLDRSAILPAGEVVERNVRPLESYAGPDLDEGALRDSQPSVNVSVVH